MICKRYLQFLFNTTLFILLLTNLSCEKFSGDQEVPVYLRVDSIYLTTDYSTQGSASESITDVWAYVDENIVGAFEMPAKFPVLKEGKHRVTFLAGIKKNGIATTRVSYPFYAPIEMTMDLVPDSTMSVGKLHATYLSSTVFNLKEDFESAGISLDTTPRSLVNINRTPVGSPLTFEGNHSGMIVLDSAFDFFEIVTHDAYNIPFAPVYVELNFNSNNNITLGAVLYVNNIIYQIPIISLVPTENKWKKIYIDLTNTLNGYPGAKGFKVFLENFKNKEVSQALILLDNLKIVTRK